MRGKVVIALILLSLSVFAKGPLKTDPYQIRGIVLDSDHDEALIYVKSPPFCRGEIYVAIYKDLKPPPRGAEIQAILTDRCDEEYSLIKAYKEIKYEKVR